MIEIVVTINLSFISIRDCDHNITNINLVNVNALSVIAITLFVITVIEIYKYSPQNFLFSIKPRTVFSNDSNIKNNSKKTQYTKRSPETVT